MDKIKDKILPNLILIVLIMIAVCLYAGNRADADHLDDLNKRVADIIITNYVDGEIISETDIAVDQIYYGSFSQENANEILVVSKILNTPHVAGLDKTATVLLAADTLELVAYREFGADIVTLECVQGHNGQKRVIAVYTTIYQGIATQEAGLFSIDNGVWNEMPIDYLEALEGEYFAFYRMNLLL